MYVCSEYNEYVFFFSALIPSSHVHMEALCYTFSVMSSKEGSDTAESQQDQIKIFK